MKMRRMLSLLGRATGALVALAIVIGVPAGFAYGLIATWEKLQTLNSDIAVAAITAAATLIVTTITVMLGRHYEKARDIEAHFRATKIEMYDQFLKELFKLFQGGHDSGDLVPFLVEWQRKLVLWGGVDVLKTYFAWKLSLKSGSPDAASMFAMDAFFRALRSDIGQTSRGLEKGAFTHLILRHAEVFLAAAKTKPQITLSELAELEKRLGLE